MKHYLIVFLVFVSTATLCHGEESGKQIPTYIDFKSADGIKRLERSKYKTAFFHLANHFEPQELKPFGGPGTAVVVMNTLRSSDSKKTRPIDDSRLTSEEKSVMDPEHPLFFSKYTQRNIFIPGAKDKLVVIGKRIKSPKGDVQDVGFQLRQLHELFLAHKFRSDIHVVDEKTTLTQITNEFKKHLNDPTKVIVVNYLRSGMGQPQKNGHLSPLGAYDEKSDSFLVMDVNPEVSHWGWVKASALLSAMGTFDTVEDRGYLVISDPE